MAGEVAGYLDLSAIAPRLKGQRGADRAFIVGRSGSGKSFLARALLDLYGHDERTPAAFRGQVVVFDPNGNFEFEGRVVRDPADVAPSRQFPAVIYRPSIKALNAESWNLAMRTVYFARGPVMLYIDEFTALEPLFGNKRFEEGNYLTGYLSRGRAQGKGAIITTQAPSGIPLTTIRNAEYFYIFDLPLQDDRERMTGVVGRYTTEVVKGQAARVDLRDRMSLGRYQFWFLGPDQHEPVRIRVRG